MICPCQMQQANPQAYANCCEPLHLGKAANSPEQLMRSRFSGFVLGLTDYVKQSWHSSTRPNDLKLAPDEHWLKLDIISAKSQHVHFRAFFEDDGEFLVLEEISDFVFEAPHWFYVSGKTRTGPAQLNRNDTCLCGSGKKYKKCCQH